MLPGSCLQPSDPPPPLHLLQSYLLPSFHKAYWMGSQADSPKLFSAWLDTLVRPNFNMSNKHWGMAGSLVQPDNARGQELCLVANASMAYSKAWGWADTDCADTFVFMCRMIREWLQSFGNDDDGGIRRHRCWSRARNGVWCTLV